MQIKTYSIKQNFNTLLLAWTEFSKHALPISQHIVRWFAEIQFLMGGGGGGEEDIISPQINTPNPEQFTPSCNCCWSTGIIERYVPSHSILNLRGGKCQQSTIQIIHADQKSLIKLI